MHAMVCSVYLSEKKQSLSETVQQYTLFNCGQSTFAAFFK